jgi:BolA protein
VNPAATRSTLESRLRQGLAPVHCDIVDESAAHAGHAGAASGGGHFRVLVVSAAFEGQGRVERHRLVYDLLRDLMPGAIHALALRTLAPSEWSDPDRSGGD